MGEPGEVRARGSHRAGHQAYRDGRALTSNPFDRGTPRHREWEGGYLDAAEAEYAESRAKAPPPTAGGPGAGTADGVGTEG